MKVHSRSTDFMLLIRTKNSATTLGEKVVHDGSYVLIIQYEGYYYG